MFQISKLKNIFKQKNKNMNSYVLELNKEYNYSFERSVYNSLNLMEDSEFWPH